MQLAMRLDEGEAVPRPAPRGNLLVVDPDDLFVEMIENGLTLARPRWRVLHLIRPAQMHLDGRLEGPTMTVDNLMGLKEDDVLAFDYPVGRLVDLSLNGKLKYRGRVVTTGRKRAFAIEELYRAL